MNGMPSQITDQTVYVTFSAEINVNTTESLISVMANLAGQGSALIDIHAGRKRDARA
jgi:hypothetical protein